MSDHVVVSDPATNVQTVVDLVCKSNEPLTIQLPDGNSVKVIPVPKPIGYRNGVPIYRDVDMQYLYLEYPHWFDL